MINVWFLVFCLDTWLQSTAFLHSIISQCSKSGFSLIFPAGPRQHRFHRSGELHQLGGAPWAAAGPVQTGHAVSAGPEQWGGAGVLPGAHRAGEWRPHTDLETDSDAGGVAGGIPCPAAHTHISPLSERLQNWFRQSRQALQWRKLTQVAVLQKRDQSVRLMCR